MPTTMPDWTVRLLLATNLISIGLSGTVAYVVLKYPRGGMAPEVVKALTAPRTAAVVQHVETPFQRGYQYVDKATGKQRSAMLGDDSPRLEQFIRGAHLTAQQESDLRDRFDKRHQLEMEMARAMVKAGVWKYQDFINLQQDFWAAEYRSLAPEQAIGLPAQFIPVNGG